MASGASSSRFVVSGEAKRLSNAGQLELLRGVAEHGASLHTTVRGLSMSPFIRDRDVVTIAPLRGREPVVGEVVAAVIPGTGRLAVHRVVERRAQGWVVRGDNCPSDDGVLGLANIVGRVVRVQRRGRDVRLGLGPEAVLIAAADRRGLVRRLRVLFMQGRAAAARLLHRAHRLPAVRRAGRRAALRYVVERAGPADMELVHEHDAPGAAPRPVAWGDDVARFVARRPGGIIGYVEFVHVPEGPWSGDWLFSLSVWGLYRGLGVGDALTRAVLDEARARGASELRLAVDRDNEPACRLYAKLGFRRVLLPELEPLLDEEAVRVGRRRVVLRRALDAEGVAA